MSDWKELDDTKPGYYEAWREAGMSSLVPLSFDIVDIPKDRWPNFKTWAWDVLFGIIGDFDGNIPSM